MLLPCLAPRAMAAEPLVDRGAIQVLLGKLRLEGDGSAEVLGRSGQLACLGPSAGPGATPLRVVRGRPDCGVPGGERGRQVAHAPGQPAHWPNRGRVGSMRDLGTWSTQERSSTSRSVSGKARIWRFTP
jgi:hypothetical protein